MWVGRRGVREEKVNCKYNGSSTKHLNLARKYKINSMVNS